MADTWTYADYDSPDYAPATKLDRAYRFRAEIRQRITANRSAGGQSRQSEPLQQLLESVSADIAAYEQELGTRGSGFSISAGDMRDRV